MTGPTSSPDTDLAFVDRNVPLLPPTDSDSDPGLTAFLRRRANMSRVSAPSERPAPVDHGWILRFDQVPPDQVAGLGEAPAFPPPQPVIGAVYLCPWCRGAGNRRGLEPTALCPWCGSHFNGLYRPAGRRLAPDPRIYDSLCARTCVTNLGNLAASLTSAANCVQRFGTMESVLEFRLALTAFFTAHAWWYHHAPGCLPGTSFMTATFDPGPGVLNDMVPSPLPASWLPDSESEAGTSDSSKRRRL